MNPITRTGRFKVMFPSDKVDFKIGDPVYSPVIDAKGNRVQFSGRGSVSELNYITEKNVRWVIITCQYTWSEYINNKFEVVITDVPEEML